MISVAHFYKTLVCRQERQWAIRSTGLPPSFPQISPRGPYQVCKSLVRLGADHYPPSNHESWNCGNAAGAGILPVLVYCFLEGPLSQGLFRHPAIKANGPGDLLQDRNIGDVPASSEVCLKYRLVPISYSAFSLSTRPVMK
jgi:hypothetical protein